MSCGPDDLTLTLSWPDLPVASVWSVAAGDWPDRVEEGGDQVPEERALPGRDGVCEPPDVSPGAGPLRPRGRQGGVMLIVLML